MGLSVRDDERWNVFPSVGPMCDVRPRAPGTYRARGGQQWKQERPA